MQNKLLSSSCYLIGPMDDVEDRGAGWRNKITPLLKQFGIEVLNPCDKPPDVDVNENVDTYKELQRLKETGQFHLIRDLYGDIRTFDLRCCDRADFSVAYVNMNVHMCGSYEEISWMNRQKKPILIFAEGGRVKVPNWLYWMLPYQHIFDHMEDVLSYLGRIDSGFNDGTNRWKLWRRTYVPDNSINT